MLGWFFNDMSNIKRLVEYEIFGVVEFGVHSVLSAHIYLQIITLFLFIFD